MLTHLFLFQPLICLIRFHQVMKLYLIVGFHELPMHVKQLLPFILNVFIYVTIMNKIMTVKY